MSIASMTSIHTVTILKPDISQGASMGAVRVFNAMGNVSCFVKPVGANKTQFFSQLTEEIDHNLWFASDPLLTEADMVSWVIENTTIYIRITRVPINVVGRNRLWVAGGVAKRIDNIKIVTPTKILT